MKQPKLKTQKQGRGLWGLLPTLVCIAIGLVFGLVILLFTNPAQAWNGFRTILLGGFAGGLRGIGNVFYTAVPIMMTGLGVAFSFKTGLFNIGGSGQFIVGAYVALYSAITFNLPGALGWIVPCLLAMVAGALWAAIAGFLNAYFKVNVVISTIMLNYIGMYMVNNLIKKTIYDPSKNMTLPVPLGSQLPKAGLDILFPGSSVNMGFFIAIAMVIVVHFLLNRTTLGYELKACGHNRTAAAYAGVSEKRNIMLAMAISGALVGLGGALMYLTDAGKSIAVLDTLAAEGFNGIPVALLAQSSPLGVIFSSLFVAYITVAGFYMQTYRFSPEIIDIIIAVIIYFSAFSLLFGGIISRLRQKARAKKAPTPVERADEEDAA